MSAPSINAPRRLRDDFRRYRGEFVLGFLALLTTNLLALSIPWLLEQAIDALASPEMGGTGGGAAEAGRYALFIAGVAVLMGGVRTLSRVVIFNAGRKIEFDTRNALFEHLSRLPPAHYQQMSVGDVMSRAVNDLGQVRLIFGPGILNLVNTSVAYTVGLGLMFSIDPWLTLAALAPYPLLLLVVRRFSWRLFRQSRAVQESLGTLSTFVQENLAGQQVVKAYNLQEEMKERFAGRNQHLLERSLDLAFTRGAMVPIFGLITGLETLVVLWLGGSAVIDGRITLGALVAFNGYLAHLTWPTIALGWMLSVWQRGLSAMERLNEIFTAEPTLRDRDPVALEAIEGSLEARGLSFTYPGAEGPALTGLSFRLERGHRLGIVGPTGSGKSTLVDLLPRLAEVPRGQLFVDGIDINDLPLSLLRRSVGYAPQEPFLFSDTLHANIAFARPEASREEVERAARLAAIHEDIASFPEGYETLVGERGVTLSGGQRQRVALARAILKDPAVLILDDSLSSVDADTEARILSGLEEVLAGRTSVVVSHRLVAVMECETILVLEEGRLAAVGDHATLLERSGFYAELWRRQRLESSLQALAADALGDGADVA
ncbi:MAG: ABC transporter ATP-binding protein [Deltaproteobacteria bacterium]|nr:ABC transporter ATP-binding protein [Deltaproteobacteria bacterium]